MSIPRTGPQGLDFFGTPLVMSRHRASAPATPGCSR
jgi:hypothetical protein